MRHDPISFMNTFTAAIGFVGLTLVPAVVFVVSKLLCSTPTGVWTKAIALYAALAASALGLLTVFACFFAPH